jgi:hypothetical protein
MGSSIKQYLHVVVLDVSLAPEQYYMDDDYRPLFATTKSFARNETRRPNAPELDGGILLTKALDIAEKF